MRVVMEDIMDMFNSIFVVVVLGTSAQKERKIEIDDMQWIWRLSLN